MYELFQSEQTGKYHFRLKAGNGEIILQSQAYAEKHGAKGGIDSVAANGGDPRHFEKREASNGKFYFVLKAANGQIIGQSQQYKSEAACDHGIASVVNNCGSDLKDLTE